MKRLWRLLFIIAVMLAAAAYGGEAEAHSGRPCGDAVTVVYGDTLQRIAGRCQTSVRAIMQANPGLTNPDRIFPGQRLRMPGRPAGQGETSYVVQPGDHLSGLARRFGTTVRAILQANPNITNPNRIFVGQRLVIPGRSPGDAGAPVFTQLDVYLVALGEGQIGCNDGLVAVTRPVAPTRAPLTAAIQELLAIEEQWYGQSGLYNALAQSDLYLQDLTLENGKATIWLAGDYRSGGVCDDPRIAAQLQQTALQFPTVNAVEIFVNGQPIAQLSSGR